MDEVDRITLTASGGPFLDEPADLSAVTVEQALNHPRWRMGPKVTVDSATMMNKGFEIVEASWVFGVPAGRIDVVVHPESVVHSLVTMADGATLAQLSPPDMRVAIQYALSWPRRLESERARLDLAALGVSLPVIPAGATNNAHMFYLLFPDLARRSGFIAKMRERGVLAVFHYLPLHSSEFYREYSKTHRPSVPERELPNCDRYADTLVRLPLYCGLAPDQDAVLAAASASL